MFSFVHGFVSCDSVFGLCLFGSLKEGLLVVGYWLLVTASIVLCFISHGTPALPLQPLYFPLFLLFFLSIAMFGIEIVINVWNIVDQPRT